MNNDDFRFMLRGKQLAGLTRKELKLLESIDKRGTGKERALLLLHGFASTPAVYRYLIPKIKHYDAIVCPALKGHAESIEAFSLSTAQDWLATAKDITEVLVGEYKKVDVLGLSLGGLLACELSKRFSLNHLFLLAPALKLQMPVNTVLKLTRLLKYLGFYHWRNQAGNILNSEHAEVSYRKLPISTIIEVLALSQNYKWVAPTCPIDLFLGKYDAVVASKEVEQLFIPLKNVTIHWLKNSAHVLPLDNDFEEIVRCINQYN